MRTIFETDEKGFVLLHRGKVRDVYSAGDGKHLLIIATDRVSAFDCVLPTPIPQKGVILTQISNYWFERTKDIVPNHLVDPAPFKDNWEYEDLDGRAVIVRRAEPLPIEAIVRGYLAGSAWKEYRETGRVCGYFLPPGLRESEELPAPIFTPSTKAEKGHDVNITFEEAKAILGAELAERIRALSLELYSFAAREAKEAGIIIADTKFEFGLVDGELILIDEALTPDSSRFWPREEYAPGRPQPSFDKQYIRDYLESIGWDKNPPAPALPPEVVENTTRKYREAARMLIRKAR
ncbi:MAG: phosphoribosylaminoimidazolesuccinocarboxamide synthase [Firmicutes bacterium]|nr:phosphoribosylaminoimidazolesuccinocarboxamide synthase [Bacillota bacterium]